MLSSPRYMIFFTTTGILVKNKGISSCRCQAALCSLWFPAPPDDKVHTTQSQQQQQIKPIQWSSAHQYFHRLCKYDSYLKETNFAVVPFWAESTTFLRPIFFVILQEQMTHYHLSDFDIWKTFSRKMNTVSLFLQRKSWQLCANEELRTFKKTSDVGKHISRGELGRFWL